MNRSRQKPPRGRMPPYQLPPLPALDGKSVKNVDPWCALEFFRIEALLRSPEVWALYERDRQRTGRTLMDRYAVAEGWKILDGAHHAWLTPSKAKWVLAPGILDLQAMAREQVPEHMGMYLRDTKNPRLLFLRLDAGVRPYTLWKELEPILRQRHKSLKKGPAEAGPWIAAGTPPGTVPAHWPHRAPPFRDVPGWFHYLRCYDLRYLKGQSLIETGRQVYNTDDFPSGTSPQDLANRACQRFKRFMSYAARMDWQNHWPPSAHLLNKAS